MKTRVLRHGYLVVAVTGLVLAACLAAPSGLSAREFPRLTPEELSLLWKPCGRVDRETATVAKGMVEKRFHSIDGGGSAAGTAPASGNVSPVTIDDGSVGANTGLKFLVNSDQLRDVAIGYLRDIGGVLTQSCRGEVYEIRGHASSEGPLDLNERLARQRAEAVRRWLVENYRIDAELVVMNRGISSPMRLSDGTEDYELSRRVEIVRRFSQ